MPINSLAVAKFLQDQLASSTIDSRRQEERQFQCPVAICQHNFEINKIRQAYSMFQPQKVLELGTHHGGTAWVWITSGADSATIIAVDEYSEEITADCRDNNALFQTWKKPGQQVAFIKGNFATKPIIEKVYTQGPYDWIFIDGNHEFQNIKRDFANYKNCIAPGGILLLHDIAQSNMDNDMEVGYFFEKLQDQGYATQKFIADPSCKWNGIGLVYGING